MADNNNPAVGGFSAIAGMFKPVAGGNIDIEDPIVEPIDPIVDPIVDPIEGDDDDPIVDVDGDDDDNDDDLVTFEKDIAAMLNTKLSEKLGITLEKDDTPNTIDEFIDFMNEISSEDKGNFANDEIAKLNEYVKNGGSIKDFYANLNESKIDLEDIDLDSISTQKQLVRENLRNLGHKEAKIDNMIKRYEEAGVLRDEAEDAQELLKEYDEKKKKSLFETQQKIAEDNKKAQQKFITDVQSTIKDIKTFLPEAELSQKEATELENYILVADKDGLTRFQKEMLGDLKKFVASALLTKNGGTIVKDPNRIRTQGKTDAIKELRKKFSANSGNPAKGKGGQSGGKGASLSSLNSLIK